MFADYSSMTNLETVYRCAVEEQDMELSDSDTSTARTL